VAIKCGIKERWLCLHLERLSLKAEVASVAIPGTCPAGALCWTGAGCEPNRYIRLFPPRRQFS
jgi:hypothetical protein